MKLAIVIPAYNEEKAIGQVLLSLPKKIPGVKEIVSIVIDDGSFDFTYEKSLEQASYSLKHVVNLGQGAAFQTGFHYAKKINSDIVVTIDGDGQHNPKNIENLVKMILETKADIVSGSRMMNTKGMPSLRIIGNFFMNVVTFLFYGIWVSDSQTGMRAFSKKAIRKMNLYSLGHEVCSEIVGEAKRQKLKFIEMPIDTIYTEYSKSKGQSMLNAMNIFTKLLAIKFMEKK
jgi:glycosyltransferase involved in cell wall biosynthesis